jgi:hypothetical protein
MKKIVVEGVAGIKPMTDTFEADFVSTKDGIWIKANVKGQPWHFSPWDEVWFGSRTVGACADPKETDGERTSVVLNEILEILKNPPRKDPVASNPNTPPDWRVAAQKISEIVTKALNTEPVKFRKT